ncbi:hypothetical protein ACFO4E_10380 [Nocardiopsis mangrovi]|uniref:Uncharacterized protein n=1 Tax=Nocardiopsis mangrovi TaxID=1179818 RepID=A0ABV9DWE2_9ACTN
MPHEFLSDEQIARYGPFPAEVSADEPEQFFRLDSQARDMVAVTGPGRCPGTTAGRPSGGRYRTVQGFIELLCAGLEGPSALVTSWEVPLRRIRIRRRPGGTAHRPLPESTSHVVRSNL